MDPLIALAVAIGFAFGLLAVALVNWIWPKEQPMDSSPTVANLRAQLAAQARTIQSLRVQSDLDRFQVYVAQMQADRLQAELDGRFHAASQN